MKKIDFKLLRKEDGVSLVEVVASVVILTFIILSVYYVFVQSAKTTKNSEDIIDATYIAQTEMEELYQWRTGTDDIKTVLIDTQKYQSDDNKHYEKKSTDSQFDIKVKVTEDGTLRTKTLYGILIQVYEKDNGPLKAQMETTLDWGS